MKTTIQGRGITLRDDLREAAERELERLGKYYDRIIEADVLFEENGHLKEAQLRVKVPQQTLMASEQGDSFPKAIKAAGEKMIPQLKEYKERQRNH